MTTTTETNEMIGDEGISISLEQRLQQLQSLQSKMDMYDRLGSELSADLDNLKLENPEEYISLKKGDTNIVDAQTNLFSKYFFEEQLLPYMVEKAESEGTTLSVITLDIDKFHDFNEQYGHQIGDLGIQYIVDKLDENIRTKDSFEDAPERFKDLRGARTGYGEEFALLLYGVDEQQAYNIAERLRSSIESGIVKKTEDEDIKLTASVGVAELRYGESSKEMMERADQAVYSSKDRGRNKVSLYSLLDTYSRLAA